VAHLALYLFGPFQALRDGQEIADFATDKVRALLAYLAVESGRPHRRDALTGLLWPNLPQKRARQSLRQTLLRLRRALQDCDPLPSWLLLQQEQIQFPADDTVWLDVAAFTTSLDACRFHTHRAIGGCRPCLERLEQAVALYRGDFLDQFFLPDSAPFEEWALLWRDRLRQQAMEALATLATYYERRADYAQAQRYGRQQVELEPWCEEGHQQLMRLLALSGKRSAALAQYKACRQALAEMLDVEPSPVTIALHDQIRAGRPFSRPPPHNTILAPTPFVGREKELADLAGLLAQPDTRLVTLVGPGGVGKSRLALQLLVEQRGLFAHGVTFVPLDSVDATAFISYSVAQALRFPLQGAQTPDEQLLNYLRQKEILLALDNLDHLLQDCRFIEAILSQAPGVMLLATSRERLNLREEQVYLLEGLTYPETDATEYDSQGHSAVALFLQAARRVDRRFKAGVRALPDVLRICRQVEGVPLGLELAASWVDTHRCADIAREIGRSDEMLTTTLRNVDPRHRSLRASFEYSWTLLSAAERVCLARLSVFQGSFDRGAALQIANASPDLLAGLIHKSLLRVDSNGRYTLHPLLHQYIAEKLDTTAQARSVYMRHGRYHAAFLQEREEDLKSTAQIHALESIGAEIDNIRQTYRWALTEIAARRNVETYINILDTGIESLYLFYLLRDWYQEGEMLFGDIATALERYTVDGAITVTAKRLLGRVLARQGKCCEFTASADKARALFKRSIAILEALPQSDRELALPLNGLGYMAVMTGDYEAAMQYFADSLARYRQAGDEWGVANVLSNLCLLLRHNGDFTGAKEAGLESLTIRRAIGDPRGIAASLNSLGLVACSLGDYAEAEKAFSESLQICQEMTYRVGISNALNGLCQATFFQGDRAAAEGFAQESLALYRDIGDQWGAGVALNNLGCIALERQTYARARDYFLEGIRIFREFEIKSSLGNALNNLGEVYYRLGQYEEAGAVLHEALVLTHATDNTPNLIEVIVRLAQLAARKNAVSRGLEWLCVVADHPAMLDEVRDKTTALRGELAGCLAPETVATIEQRARGREVTSLIEEILEFSYLFRTKV